MALYAVTHQNMKDDGSFMKTRGKFPKTFTSKESAQKMANNINKNNVGTKARIKKMTR